MSRPTVTIEELSSDILKLYSMKISEVKEQLSYDDAMFLFTGNGCDRYIAKYYNPTCTSRGVLQKIVEVLEHLHSFSVPQLVPCSNGSLMTEIPHSTSRNGCKTESFLVVFAYIAGDLLCFQKKPPKFWNTLGVRVAEINLSLSKVKCENYDRDSEWDPLNLHRTLSQERKHFPSDLLPNVDVQTIINSSLGFSDILQDCPKQLIHGDVNEYNIVVGEDGDINIIDFNDLSYCYRVFEVAHCIGYMMEAQKCDIQVGRQIYEGCSSVMELSLKELGLIYSVILCRFILSVTVGRKSINLGSANQYVHECVHNNIEFIKDFQKLGKENFDKFVLGL